MGVEEFVLAGMSGSLRDHPSEFIESRKAVEVMVQEMSFVLERKRIGQATEDSLLSKSCPAVGRNRSEAVEALDCKVAMSLVGDCTTAVLFLADDVPET
jgi:hypothetical protein